MNTQPLAVYIHWPYCKKKCPYCDFNSHVPTHAPEMQRWATAYAREIGYMAESLPDRTVTSIFFGGGTPSLMSPTLVADILSAIRTAWDVAPLVEVTLEANPTSIEAEKFRDFRHAGVNRVSVGVQSLNAEDLHFLGREHSPADALNALEIAASIFDRYSFDLIYARPNQTLRSWQQELAQALPYVRDHLSLYQLTIEKGTPFYSAYQKHAFTMPKEALAAKLYDYTTHAMRDHDLHAYEVSNYAREGAECQHNLAYWRYQEYVGIGPGAHGRVRMDTMSARHTTMNWHAPEQWLHQVTTQGHGLQRCTPLPQEEIVAELLMMGLRLTEGINLKQQSKSLGFAILPHLKPQAITLYTKEGLLTHHGDTLRATEKGRMVLTRLTAELLA